MSVEGDFLYHYTTFATFEKILLSRCIRFTRLDYLEDMYEGHSKLSNVKKCVFVSCWVNTDEELIPHWKIYGDVKMRQGIRIGLPSCNLFDEIKHKRDTGESFIKLREPFKNWDNSSDWNALLYGPYRVEYVEQWPEPVIGDDKKSKVPWSGIGIKKLCKYTFEQETRFRITPPENSRTTFDQGQERHNDMLKKYIPQAIYIDHPITEQAFKKMQVMYSPLTEESRVKTIQLLCENYGLLGQPERRQLPILSV